MPEHFAPRPKSSESTEKIHLAATEKKLAGNLLTTAYGEQNASAQRWNNAVSKRGFRIGIGNRRPSRFPQPRVRGSIQELFGARVG